MLTAQGGTFLASEQKRRVHLDQGCQIFLGSNIPNWEKYTKCPKTVPNGHK
jgi:hypothetical protein